MIKLKDITKYYYSDSSVTLALKDINLEFKKGEFVAITGKSGSGKSTLINLISGMDSYEEGEMYFKGMETSYYDDKDWEIYRKNNISFVYQSYNLIDSYTALQNVEAVMMICENDENRRTKKERRQKAMEMLKKVGLEKQAHNRASHMSSGQKQRLGIARALAKETDVIVADEPTGNLDVENGKAIMAILHELSKENKLVLVVTHNYEQAEEYVTRKIRLFDGEVVEDLKIDSKLYENRDFQSDYENEVAEEKEAERTLKTATEFVHMNRFAQPHRSFFVFLFILASALATLIFTGYFLSNLDDAKTRNISEKIFANVSDDRVLVKRLDGKVLTDEDYERLSEISRVELVEKYDMANDYYYFAEEDVDYNKKYEVGSATKKITIEKLKFEHFLKSANGLTDEDIKSGRLPETFDEIVVYSDDDSLIGQKKEIYISGKYWKEKQFYGHEFTIVGILEKNDNQIYFSEKFISGFDGTINYADVKFKYTIEDKKLYSSETAEDVITEKEKTASCYLKIADDLVGNQVRLPNAIMYTLETEGKQYKDHIQYKTLMEEGKITREYDDETEKVFDVVYVMDGSISSESVIEVSSELYYQIAGENDMMQASLFIEDYAYMDDVLNDLYDNDYDAISALRVSVTDYNQELVSSRLVMLAISVIIILVIFVLDILVIHLLMKLKKGDFMILKSLGMTKKMANQMNYYELITLTFVADIVAIIAGYICCESGVPLICDIMKYFRIRHYLIVIVINGLMALVTGYVYNRYLGKRFRLTSLKND